MTLSEHEWCFDSVPNDQLIDCCYYEYGRESEWLRQGNLHVVQAGGGGEFGYFHPALNPLPWQSLTNSVKSGLKRLNVSLPSGPPVRLPNWREARSLYEACEAKANDFRDRSYDRQAAGRDTNGLGLDVKQALEAINNIPPRMAKEHGEEIALFEINWDKFTDGEIASAFAQWIAINRPKGVGASERRGPKLTLWRSKLERLGIMRLLHHYTFDEMTERLPASYGKKAKYSNPSDCYAEREGALKDFRELFSYLPTTEKPISYAKKTRNSNPAK